MRHAHLVALVNPPTSQYSGNWSNSLSRADWLRGSFYTDLGRLLERGRFDMVFLADALAVPEDAEGEIATTLRTGGKGAIYLDPIVGLSHIAATTTRLGLGATVSTTFQPPFSIARTLLSLDQLSGGRVAWNIVTSTTDAEARNYGLPGIPNRVARYDHADEVVQSVKDLWESWEPDALRLDGVGRIFADPARVHRAPERNGHPALSRGPLAIPRSPQNRPVLMQAGASPRGLEFAARWAEVVFATGGSADTLRTQRTQLRERARQLGRDPNTPPTCPRFSPSWAPPKPTPTADYGHSKRHSTPTRYSSRSADCCTPGRPSSYLTRPPLRSSNCTAEPPAATASKDLCCTPPRGRTSPSRVSPSVRRSANSTFSPSARPRPTCSRNCSTAVRPMVSW